MRSPLLTLAIPLSLSACGEPAPPTVDAPVSADIRIKRGGAATIDGSSTEWADATTTSVMFAGRSISIAYKHDGQRLLFAFSGLAQGSPGFAELFVDANGDRACAWGGDDWWFHASATDCSSTGMRDQWQTCVANATNWEANNSAAGQVANVVEIAIPFTTMNVATLFGLAFHVTDTNGTFGIAPAGADPARPCTWATATIDG